MSATRELILERIRVAVADLPRTADAVADVPVPWAYGEATPMPDVCLLYTSPEPTLCSRTIADSRDATVVAVHRSTTAR